MGQDRSFSQSSRVSMGLRNSQQVGTLQNEAANKELLNDLCKEATTHVKYKPLGGGRRVQIDDNVSFIVPNNLGMIINQMLSKIKIDEDEFIKELGKRLERVDTSKHKSGRSAWTKVLYENPFYVLREVRRKVILTDTISGEFKLNDTNVTQLYKDVIRRTQVQIIQTGSRINIGPAAYDGNSEQEQKVELTNKIRDFLGNKFEKNKKAILGCHQGIPADIMNCYYSAGDPIEFLKANLLISTMSATNETVFFQVDLDTKKHLLFFKRIKKFTEDVLDSFEQESLETLFGNNYRQLLLRSTGFAVEGMVNLDFDKKEFTCNTTFIKN